MDDFSPFVGVAGICWPSRSNHFEARCRRHTWLTGRPQSGAFFCGRVPLALPPRVLLWAGKGGISCSPEWGFGVECRFSVHLRSVEGGGSSTFPWHQPSCQVRVFCDGKARTSGSPPWAEWRSHNSCGWWRSTPSPILMGGIRPVLSFQGHRFL